MAVAAGAEAETDVLAAGVGAETDVTSGAKEVCRADEIAAVAAAAAVVVAAAALAAAAAASADVSSVVNPTKAIHVVPENFLWRQLDVFLFFIFNVRNLFVDLMLMFHVIMIEHMLP